MSQTRPDSAMSDSDYDKLLDDTERAVHQHFSVALLGWNTTAKQLVLQLRRDVPDIETPVFDAKAAVVDSQQILPFKALAQRQFDVLVVTANRNKEAILRDASPYIQGTPRIVVSGYDHYDFHDATFHDVLAELKQPSLANGYPNTLPHLYQCLRNAARLELEGVVAEFGVYQGGTTMFLAKVIQRLGTQWPIYGLDTFQGFPKRRHQWDMYDHENLSASHASVAKYLEGTGVQLISGDIVDTAHRLSDKQFVLSFIDTDNYSPANAALDVVQENTVIGGAIVFDHYTGQGRFRYTLGERMAATRLEADKRYFNLHGTGVFLRQC